MPGDWLKVEKDTPEKPEILAVAAKLGLDPEVVFAKCFKLWRWFDSNTADGNARSVTAALLDSLVHSPGFTQALIEVGWLHAREGIVQVPNFNRHMGQSAKKRALTARRVSASRVRGQPKCNANRNAASVTEALPEREKNNTPPTPQGARGKNPRKPRPPNPLFDAVAEITGSDPSVCGSHVAKVAAALAKADPPYTPEEVRRLPGAAKARNYNVPLTLGSIEKCIGWVRQSQPAHRAEEDRAERQRGETERLIAEKRAKRKAAQESNGEHDSESIPF